VNQDGRSLTAAERRANQRARLPGFGRELVELRRQGMVPARPIVVALDSWKWGRSYPRLVVAEDLDPSEADFSVVAGLECFLAWSSKVTSVARRDTLIRVLVKCAPIFLWACDMAAPHESFIVVSRAKGLELREYA